VHLFVVVIEVLLAGLVIGGSRHGSGSLLHGSGVGSLVHVRQQNRLREERLVVLPRASISVSACSHFEIEGTVHPAMSPHSYTQICSCVFSLATEREEASFGVGEIAHRTVVLAPQTCDVGLAIGSVRSGLRMWQAGSVRSGLRMLQAVCGSCVKQCFRPPFPRPPPFPHLLSPGDLHCVRLFSADTCACPCRDREENLERYGMQQVLDPSDPGRLSLRTVRGVVGALGSAFRAKAHRFRIHSTALSLQITVAVPAEIGAANCSCVCNSVICTFFLSAPVSLSCILFL